MKINDLEILADVRALAASGEARQRRLAAGLSLSEVAGSCGVDGSTIWRWEQGLRVPRGRPALTYARLLTRLDGATGRAS